MPGKPAAAIGQPWRASSLDCAVSIAKWLSDRCGLPVLVEPAAHSPLTADATANFVPPDVAA